MPRKSDIRATSGTNHEGTSAHNRRVIIDALRQNRSLSRAELARATSLTKQTISNLIEGLESDGLVSSENVVRQGRGQPATPYRLVPEGAFALGVQIDRHLTRIVVVNLTGDEVMRREAALPADNPEEGCAIILEEIAEVRAALAREFPDGHYRMSGLGVAMPGPFGTPVPEDDRWVMSAWQSFPLIDRLTESTGLTVTLQNDATACARAEKMVGLADGLDNVVCIYLGYGVGAGLILNGEIYTGSKGNAGEIGTMLMANQGVQTPLEHHASLSSLYKYLKLDEAQPDLSAELETLLMQNAPRVEAWLERAATELRSAIHTIEAIFDPQTIIICGGAPKLLANRLVDRIEPLVSSSVDYPVRTLPRLLVGLTDIWAVARGAALEQISRHFDPRFSALLKSGAVS